MCEPWGEKEGREGLDWPSALSPRAEEVLACMQSEQWRDLIGDYEEAHNLRLPKVCMVNTIILYSTYTGYYGGHFPSV